MSRFPQTEPEIAALALVVAQGLREAAEDFPAPPISADELQARLDRYNAATAATVAAQNGLRVQHAEKDEALEHVVDGLKADLRYAEVTVRDQPEKLTRLGWGPRRRSSTLQPPGEVRDITVVSEGDNWVILRWKQPVDGGTPTFYRIQRRLEGVPWEDAGTATDAEQLMSNQPRGVELYYRVIAVNKAGDGPPSATVTLVL